MNDGTLLVDIQDKQHTYIKPSVFQKFRAGFKQISKLS